MDEAVSRIWQKEGPDMSRHQSRRRRTYGRRQHELHERKAHSLAWDLLDDATGSTEIGNEMGTGNQLFDLFSPRLRLFEGRG